jgi:Trypsin
MRARNRWSATIVALALCLLLAAPAVAVIDGRPDGNQHPNVGMVIGYDAQGVSQGVCTGTLVTPTIVLTAAHCLVDEPGFPPEVSYTVSFEPQIPLDSTGFPVVTPLSIPGTPDPNPLFDLVSSRSVPIFLRAAEQDVGLIHLSHPASDLYPAISPATIVGSSALERYRTGGRKPNVLQVGYGVQRSGPPGRPSYFFLDGSRNQSQFPLQAFQGSLIWGQINPNDALGFGMPIYGDSGSPWFIDGAVSAVYACVSGPNNRGCGPRLDTGPGRDFLRSRGLVP